MQIQVLACTVAYNARVRALVSKVQISQPFNRSSPPKSPKLTEFSAIWDTGATNSVVTPTVVSRCGLKPIGMTKVYTADGEALKPRYLVSVFLPNKVAIPELWVTEGKLKDADVLVGMDIIGQGDFAVTNLAGKTTLSFRMPSIERIDFTTQQPDTISQGLKTLTKVGRNAPCPCGSGKKYKNCCGK